MLKNSLKLLILILAICASINNLFGMEPYTSSTTPEEEFFASCGWFIQLECPNCGEYRLFPSVDFVVTRRMNLTKKQEQDMALAIENYVGEIVPGRMCPFCGRKIPTSEYFK